MDVNQEPYLKLQDEDIRALSIVDRYKYLGVQIGPRMQFASLADRVQKGLHSISRAPLVPCQRVYILRTHLLPSLVHFLTFGTISLKLLNSADVSIRKSVRKWLLLPKDTPNAFLHAPIKMGGMGIFNCVAGSRKSESAECPRFYNRPKRATTISWWMLWTKTRLSPEKSRG